MQAPSFIPAPVATMRSELRVLLVEDSELDAGLLLRELRRAGYEVTSRRVQTAVDLAAALREAQWDIVLSDYKMPKFNGMDALAIVRSLGRDIPFILVSGAVGEETAVAAMRAGASDYFVKGRLATLGPAVARELREASDRRVRRESEEQVRKLYHAVQQAPVSLMITDTTGRIEYVNPKFMEQTGYTFDEVKGQNPRFLKSGRVPPAVYDELWRTIAAGDEWRGELQNRSKGGAIFWELVSISPIRDAAGSITHFLATKLDITAHKLAEQKIHEQAALLDIASDAIYVRGPEGVIRFWSLGAERLYGWTRDEAQGRRLTELDLQELSAEAELGAVLQKQDTWTGERRQRTRQGEEVVVLSRLTVVRNEHGEPAYIFAINTDITEKKRLEEQFLRAQRMESLGMLAAGIAHDLNNILAPILMGAPLLRRIASEPGDLRLISTLEKCGERGAGLVRQILGFAHGIGGEPRLVQVKHLMRDIAEVVTETFPKSIAFEAVVPNDLWPVLANPTQVHQVLLNLCVNARDAMPKGGALLLRGENCTLDADSARAITGAKPGAWLVIHVEDTGTGIAPEVLGRIWEPFFTTKLPGKGTGLGLSTVRGIIEHHQGFLTLHSEVGRGTTFRVYLPAATPAFESEVGTIAPATSRGNGELILVADDEESIRQMAGMILASAGYRTLSASDGVEAAALFIAHASEIKLVITDFDMPNLNGAGLANAIHAIDPAMKILAMSGLVSTSRTLEMRPETFATASIAKPFDVTTLLSMVAQLLAEPAKAS